MNESYKISVAERVESLKAGTLAALCFTLAYSLVAVSNSLILANQFEELAVLQIPTALDWLVRIASAWLSGFLFGVTYRYVIRDNENPHLKSGAVLAFGLVRGLASLEALETISSALWSLSVLGIESVLCFLVARLALDWALHHHWVKPFKSS